MTPRVALTLALGLHELTTNASKYGALSVPAGRIEVRWRVERRPSQPPMLWIEWRERGGPPVAAPKRQGFGTRFIEGSVASELQGKARLRLRSRRPDLHDGNSARFGDAGRRRARSEHHATPPR